MVPHRLRILVLNFEYPNYLRACDSGFLVGHFGKHCQLQLELLKSTKLRFCATEDTICRT